MLAVTPPLATSVKSLASTPVTLSENVTAYTTLVALVSSLPTRTMLVTAGARASTRMPAVAPTALSVVAAALPAVSRIVPPLNDSGPFMAIPSASALPATTV